MLIIVLLQDYNYYSKVFLGLFKDKMTAFFFLISNLPSLRHAYICIHEITI